MKAATINHSMMPHLFLFTGHSIAAINNKILKIFILKPTVLYLYIHSYYKRYSGDIRETIADS